MKEDNLHSDLRLLKGEYFVKAGRQNFMIGQVIKGVLRGYTPNDEGEEVVTHFFKEGDLVSGNYIPNIPATMSVQALEDCQLSVANYKDVMSCFNQDSYLTRVILGHFQKLNEQNHARVMALIDGNALTKYKWFLKEYPGLINRIPHYHIANFLGITPTQLSRTKKSFSQQM
ncbi:cAMP-binding protein (plasmid) [Fulvitalea axinellae]|uniref:cAMP-binding protein n=1 Tax=Fulvitalea axinellae TaxID=1182444 RepID=A0AAU9D0X6_9BACT|nr:cAMP-binding protein [Fulvitalea axinellae]